MGLYVHQDNIEELFVKKILNYYISDFSPLLCVKGGGRSKESRMSVSYFSILVSQGIDFYLKKIYKYIVAENRSRGVWVQYGRHNHCIIVGG